MLFKMAAIRGWLRRKLKFFISILQLYNLDPENSSLDDLDCKQIEPILWPYRSLGSPWWWTTQLSFSMFIVNLIVIQLAHWLFPGSVQVLLHWCGLLDLSAAISDHYRGLFVWNYVNICLFAVVINVVLLRHRRVKGKIRKTFKTFYSVLLEAGQLARLRHLTGLYSDAQRLRLWRITLLVNYCALPLWIPGCMVTVGMNTYLIFFQDGQLAKKWFWIAAYLPMAIDGGNLAHSFVSYTWLQIYFFAHRLDNIGDQLSLLSKRRLAHDAVCGQLIRLSRDWQAVKRKFAAQSPTMNAACGLVCLQLGAGSFFWLYFVTHLIGTTHILVTLMCCQILGLMFALFCSIGITAPRIVTARRRYVNALHSLQSSRRLVTRVLTVTVNRHPTRLRQFVLRSIQLESRDDSALQSELVVRCGPLFRLTYQAVFKLYLEMAALYLIFYQIINQSNQSCNQAVT